MDPEVLLTSVEQKLGIEITRKELLQQALTHRSFGQGHYERLEFLGDAVLDLVISEWLMQRHPTVDEGWLTRMRAELVNRVTLSEVASYLGLAEFIAMGRGEQNSGPQFRLSVLADIFESVVATIYLDRGFQAVKDWIAQVFDGFVRDRFDPYKVRDYKSYLQEWTQSRELQLPVYELLREEGPDHSKTFHVRCTILSGDSGEGCGSTKKQAEQLAAKDCIERLGRESRGI